jgi:hypothetical protein
MLHLASSALSRRWQLARILHGNPADELTHLLILQAPLDATLQRLDGLVGQLHAALPPNTLLILHTGQASSPLPQVDP